MSCLFFAGCGFGLGWLTEHICYLKRKPQGTAAAGAGAIVAAGAAAGSVAEHPTKEAAEKYRNDASTHGDNRSRLMNESQEAYKMGDKKAAKELADQGKAEGVLMEENNQKAAVLYFAFNNPKNGKNDAGQIDLHWLQVKEALDFAEQSIQNEINRTVDSEPALTGDNMREVVFIVGMGNHSEGGVRKIKPALEEMITQKYGYSILDEKPHKGCLTVEFKMPLKPKSAGSNSDSTRGGTETGAGTGVTNGDGEKKSSCVIA